MLWTKLLAGWNPLETLLDHINNTDYNKTISTILITAVYAIYKLVPSYHIIIEYVLSFLTRTPILTLLAGGDLVLNHETVTLTTAALAALTEVKQICLQSTKGSERQCMAAGLYTFCIRDV